MLLCGLAVTAPVAAAQEDEIFVDPDSPSGKEYALPIDRARQQSAPQAPRRASGGAPQPAPLFGSGVGEDRAATGAAAPRRGSDRGGERAAAGDTAAAKASQPAQRRAAAERRTQAAAPQGSGGLVAIAGACVGVLLIGALAGLALRRRAAAR